MAVQKANYIYRDFQTDGVPASGANKPKKREIRERGTWVEDMLSAGLSNGGLIYDTKANLDADLDHPANASAWVVEDSGNNGIYRKSGASGSGSWTKIAELPYSVVYAQNDGSGTADAVVATSSVPIVTTAYSQLISIPFTAANTGAMTLAIDGETPRPLVTNTGEPIPAGYVKSGMSALVQIDSAGNYRLFSYGDAAAVQAVVEGLLLQTEAARDAALAAVPNAFPVTLATLKSAIDPATHIAAYLLQPGREGQFRWDSSNLSAKVTLDTAQGLYVAPDSDATGASGAWVRVYDGPIKARWFGVIGDYNGVLGTDNSAALGVIAAVHPAGASIDFEDLQVSFSSDVSFTKDVRFTGAGWKLYGNNAMLTVSGTRTELTYISAAASAGARTVTVNSATGISAGDILILQNTNTQSFYGNAIDGRDYTDGEFIEVESVSGTTVTFKTLLKTAYAGGAAFKVFKVDLVDFSADGGTIEGTDSFVLNLRHCTNLNLKIDVLGGTTRALYVNQCYRGYIPPGGTFYHKPAVASGNNYGISFSNSQDILVDDVFAFGLRHGVSMGGAPGDGAVPCRNVIVRRSRISNATHNLQAADIHGWAVNCYYVDCDVDGAVGIGGLNCGAPGCSVVAKSEDASSSAKAILLTETVGGLIDLRNVTVRIAPDFAGTSIFGIAASAQFGGGIGVQDYDLLLDGLEVECTAAITVIANHLHNMEGSVKWTLSMDSVVLTGDTSGLTKLLYLTVSNTVGHSSPPIRAEKISQRKVICKSALADSVYIPTLSGGWAGCQAETPGVGSSPDGRYIRQADGTQLCQYAYSGSQALSTAFLGGFRSGAITWDYPIAFIAAPQLSVTPTGGSAFSGVATTPLSETSATFFLTAITTQTAATRTAHLIAIGRWY